MDIKKEITLILRELGVPTNSQGYHYIRTAIELCYDDETYINKVTKRLYPDIAKKHNTIPSRVERSIRHSIKITYDRLKVDEHNKIFGNCINFKKGQLTNSEFIATLTDNIKMGI